MILTVPSIASGFYWRFEQGTVGQPVSAVLDEYNKQEACAEGQPPILSDEVSMAIVPSTNSVNKSSVIFNGGYYRVKQADELDRLRGFTIECWVKFGSARPTGEVLFSKGIAGQGNWHVVYRADGSVRACIYGASDACLFGPGADAPLRNVWYHIAATYEDTGEGSTRICAYVNGQLRDTVTGPKLGDTGGTDLFIGSFINGQFPFHGAMDELRITPRVLKPNEMLISGPKPIPQAGTGNLQSAASDQVNPSIGGLSLRTPYGR
jgi:hypothetical protein